MCREPLCVDGADPAWSHFIGEVAHIVAERPEGPRGHLPLSVEERNTEPNLLLLCLLHHKLVDDDRETYTAEELRLVKLKHEEWVSDSLAELPSCNGKLFHLYYINIPRLSLLAALQSKVSLDLSRYGSIHSLHQLGWELNGLVNGFKQLLEVAKLRAIPLADALHHTDPRGMLVSFDLDFRTKNITLPTAGQSYETLFTGDRTRDPHIYCKTGGWTVISNIDRRWITTTTAFVKFRSSSGRSRFAGIGFINDVVDQPGLISMTPYVLGLQLSPEMEAFYEAMSRYNVIDAQSRDGASEDNDATPSDLPF